MINLKKISESSQVLHDFLNLKGDKEGERSSFIDSSKLNLFISFPLLDKKEGFVFYLNEKPIARIFLHLGENKNAYFSFFTALKNEFKENLVFIREKLIEIELWAKSRGASKIIGPYFYSSFLPYRFRVDQEEDNYAWEPNQPSYEYDFFKELNFLDDESYFSNFSKNFSPWDKNGQKEYEDFEKKGLRLKFLTEINLEEIVVKLYELSLICFKDNYLFKEIPFEVFKNFYIPALLNYDLNISHITLNSKSEIVAFHFIFKDGAQVILKSVCIHPDFRGLGIFQAGLFASIKKAQEIYPDVKSATAALIHDENLACKKVAARGGPERLHIYKLVSKEI